MKDDLLKIISFYGVLPQLKHFNSEVFELTEAIINAENNRLIGISRKPSKLAIEHIAEEIADCYVMLNQFQLYYGIENKQIEETMKFKIDRQLERINKEN